MADEDLIRKYLKKFNPRLDVVIGAFNEALITLEGEETPYYINLGKILKAVRYEIDSVSWSIECPSIEKCVAVIIDDMKCYKEWNV